MPYLAGPGALTDPAFGQTTCAAAAFGHVRTTVQQATKAPMTASAIHERRNG
jgi:hypothetical protein